MKRKKIVEELVDEKGYHYVMLEKDGKKHKKYIHHLVYQTFVGEIPDGYTVEHINGDKSNNAVWNLKLVKKE